MGTYDVAYTIPSNMRVKLRLSIMIACLSIYEHNKVGLNNKYYKIAAVIIA